MPLAICREKDICYIYSGYNEKGSSMNLRKLGQGLMVLSLIAASTVIQPIPKSYAAHGTIEKAWVIMQYSDKKPISGITVRYMKKNPFTGVPEIITSRETDNNGIARVDDNNPPNINKGVDLWISTLALPGYIWKRFDPAQNKQVPVSFPYHHGITKEDESIVHLFVALKKPKIKGTAYDQNNDPVADATVYINETATNENETLTGTNSEGKYGLVDLNKDDTVYTIFAYKLGCSFDSVQVGPVEAETEITVDLHGDCFQPEPTPSPTPSSTPTPEPSPTVFVDPGYTPSPNPSINPSQSPTSSPQPSTTPSPSFW